MPKTPIILMAGDSLNIILPSGSEINVEVTQDTSDIVYKEFVLFSEERLYDGKHTWNLTWPKAIKGEE